MRLFEYFLHPYNVIQGIYNYHNELDVDRRVSTRKRIQRQIDGNPYISHQFNTLYEENRINLYATYHEMDRRDPMVTVVLDTYAQTCTQPNMEGGKENSGRSVWGITRDKKVQEIVTDFLDRVETEELPPEMVRLMCCYGDSFEGMQALWGKGVVRFDPYDPWDVAVLLDQNRRFKGYGQADNTGEVANRDSVVSYWDLAHFRMPRRRRTLAYGVETSILYNVREYWTDLQWIMDKLAIQRLWMQPNRLAIALDIGGMSSEDAFEMCEEVRQRLYREVYFDQSVPEMHSMPTAWGEFADIVIPKGADNQTTITTIPQSTVGTPLDDLYFFLRRFFAGLKFPAGYLNLEIDTGFNRDQPLEKQDIAYALASMRIQRAFLKVLTRAVMVHMAYLGIDPRLKKNQFTLMMSPVSFMRELEQKEVLEMRFDLMDRAMQLGRDYEWNMEFWVRYVMEEYARMPVSIVDVLLTKVEKPEGEEEISIEEPILASEQRDKLKRVQELLEGNQKAKEALLFFANGASMMTSSEHIVPGFDKLMESVKERKELSGELEVEGTYFKKLFDKRMKDRRDRRKEFFVNSLRQRPSDVQLRQS